MRTLGKLVRMCFVAVLGLCGCQHDPYAQWFLTKNVPENTVIGSYHITGETLHHFTRKPVVFDGRRVQLSADAKVVLQSDHAVSISKIPFAADDPLCTFEATDATTAAGTWQMYKDQNYTTVLVTLFNLHPLRGCPQGEYGFVLKLFDDSALRSHSATKYPLLHMTMGDPDSGDALQFERD